MSVQCLLITPPPKGGRPLTEKTALGRAKEGRISEVLHGAASFWGKPWWRLRIIEPRQGKYLKGLGTCFTHMRLLINSQRSYPPLLASSCRTSDTPRYGPGSLEFPLGARIKIFLRVSLRMGIPGLGHFVRAHTLKITRHHHHLHQGCRDGRFVGLLLIWAT